MANANQQAQEFVLPQDTGSLADPSEFETTVAASAVGDQPAAAAPVRAPLTPVAAQSTAPARPIPPAQPRPVIGAPGTAQRAATMQRALETRATKPVSAKLSKLGNYKATGIAVEYTENKIGVMPNVIEVINTIAEYAGVNTGDPAQFAPFIEALVIDIYVNPYSDKQTFEGEIAVGDFRLPRRYIKAAIEPVVGTMHRRYARAMAGIVVDVMANDPTPFNEVLDRRCVEMNLSTRAEAMQQFDGNEGLTLIPRQAGQRAAERKFLALAKRTKDGDQYYAVSNSSDAIAAGSRGGMDMPSPVV